MRKKYIIALQIVFIISIIVFFSKTINANLLISLFSKISIPFLIVTLIIMITDKVIMGIKWNLLLHVFNVKVPFSLPIITYLRGKVFHLFIPLNIGMDAYKTYYMKKFSSSTVHIVSSIFVERFVGAVSSLAIISILIYFPLSKFEVAHLHFITFMGFLFFVGISISLFMLIKSADRMKKISCFKFIPLKIRKYFDKFTSVISMVKQGESSIWYYYLFSIFEKVFYGSAIFFSAKSIGIHNLDYLYVISATPLLALLERLPISISSIGVREGLIFLLFKPYFADPTTPIAIALALRCADIIVTLFCLLLWLVKHDPKSYRKDIQAVSSEITTLQT